MNNFRKIMNVNDHFYIKNCGKIYEAVFKKQISDYEAYISIKDFEGHKHFRVIEKFLTEWYGKNWALTKEELEDE